MLNKRLLQELGDEKKILALLIFIKIINLILNIFMVFTIANFISEIYIGNDKTNIFVSKILIIILIKIVTTILYNKFSYFVSINIKKNFRNALFKKVYGFKMEFASKLNIAEIITLCVDGIEQLNIFYAEMFPQLIFSILSPIILFIILVNINRDIALILILVVPFIPISIFLVQKIANNVVKKYLNSYTNLSDIFIDFLYGLTTLKVFSADEIQNKKLNKFAEDFRIRTMKLLIVQLNNITIMDLISYLGTGFGIYMTIKYFFLYKINLYESIIFILLSQEFFTPLRTLGALFHVAMNGISSANNLFEVLEIEDKEKFENYIEEKVLDINLRNVSFSYGDKYILNSINMDFRKNSITAIIGESGSGKSTISKLISGILVKNNGEVLYNNRENINLDNLIKNITVVDNNPYIFRGTLRYNLKMAGNVNDEQMLSALEFVRLKDYFNSLDSLDSKIEDQGSNLSGGQKQRIAIARAILKKSKVLILDEAISNVDVESEEIILKLLKELKKTMSIVMITHRLKNTEISDYIYYIEDGVIKEEGSFESIIKKPIFKNLYETQIKLERWGLNV